MPQRFTAGAYSRQQGCRKPLCSEAQLHTAQGSCLGGGKFTELWQQRHMSHPQLFNHVKECSKYTSLGLEVPQTDRTMQASASAASLCLLLGHDHPSQGRHIGFISMDAARVMVFLF